MPRTPRKQQWTEEACYHVMNRGHNRERIFGDDDDRRHFLGLLARYRERFGLRLYHYFLMTNHFHVLVQLERPADLSKWLSGMLRAYVHYFNQRYRFVGHLWQGRFNTLPTMFKSAPQGGANKRGRTDSIHDANLLYSNLDAFHQGTDDLSPFMPACSGQAGLHPLPEVLEAL